MTPNAVAVIGVGRHGVSRDNSPRQRHSLSAVAPRFAGNTGILALLTIHILRIIICMTGDQFARGA
jgi:hypothetical protein